jgi:Uma2 family endonuclease
MKAAVARRFRWTVKKYFRAAEVGLFDDRRVELLNGEIIEVPSQAHPHRLSITRLTRLLIQAFDPSHYWVVVQGTLVLSRYSAPDPDFHVFDVPEGTPDDELPTPFLVIEVSDTTYLKDSGPKLRLYASAGVPDYWMVNLPKRQIEVYRQPENPTGRLADCRYASITTRRAGDLVTPLHRPDLTFPVGHMLG